MIGSWSGHSGGLMLNGTIEVESWEDSYWGRKPTNDELAFYSNKPAAMEPLHHGLRTGEVLMRELGYMLKRCDGRNSVQRFNVGLRNTECKLLMPLVGMLDAWLEGKSWANSVPSCALYCASTPISLFIV